MKNDNDFKKNRDIRKISISLDKDLNDNLEKKEINKSKLINFLIKDFFEHTDYKTLLITFLKK